MPEPFIPFNRPFLLDQGLAHVRMAFQERHVSGDGAFSRRCQEFLERRLGTGRALLTTSCTDALELSALLLDIKAGDEVIMPSFTFVSTANAFALRGARPIFVDVRPDTFNIDESAIERAISPQTRTIVVVHYGGVGCEMDAISSIAARRGIPVVEDNAHGLFGAYRGKPLGTFGTFSTLSFHETKNLSCGEGGALMINDPRLVERAEILREKGTNRSRFFRGEIDRYSWVDIGSSFLPSDILAALLWSQMEVADRIQDERANLFRRYRQSLSGWADRQGIMLPTCPAYCDPSYHLFALLLPNAAAQQALLAHFKRGGVNAVFHYQPLHLSPQGRRFGCRPGDCPVAESIAERIVRLPLFFGLRQDEQDRVISVAVNFRA
jgi:dTDP-4-amino-4,6-dideoxygalactose transaminase